MDEKAIVTGIELPTNSRVSVKIEVSAAINVSAFVARQKANRFLIMQAGDQLSAGEPELSVGLDLAWRLPVNYAPSGLGLLGVVGHLLINCQTGEVTIADEQTIEELLEFADVLYERTPP